MFKLKTGTCHAMHHKQTPGARIINMDCCWPLTLKENIKLNDVVQLLYIMYSALYCSGTLQYSPAGSDFGATLIEIFGVPLSLSPQTKMERLGHSQLWEKMETLPGHQTKCSDVLKSTQEGLAELKSKSLAAPTEFPSALSSLSP